MRRIFYPIAITVAFLFCETAANAQNIQGARATSLGGAAITLDDVWSVFHNQAGLARLEGMSAGVYYENRFMMKELGDKGLAIGIPVGNGAFGLSFRSFGYSAFSDSRAGLAYAMNFSDNFSAGVEVNYHSIRIAEGYGSQQAVSVEGGFRYQMTDHLVLAAHINNPTRAKLTEFNDERIPTALRAGAAYRFSDKVQLLGEMKKVSDKNYRISGGVEYNIVQSFSIRAGFGSYPAQLTFGFGGVIGVWRLDVAAAYHNVLGFTPQLSFVYAGQQKKK
ncbi:MAG: hypothetical protein IT223_03185 [Crocinitomicaceae bacterium]|nr:hypothetical protein [Crocinitomicaceae bacterium]